MMKKLPKCTMKHVVLLSCNGACLNKTLFKKIHTYTHAYIHTYTHTYIHTYTHTYIYIHTHIHTPNWTQCTKGSIRKKYFPNVEEGLKMKLNLTQNFTAIVTGHGKTRAYLRRFKIKEEPTFPCGTAEQTTDHLIFECETLTKERERLKTTAQQNGSWPTNKKDLIRRHYRDFAQFINDIPFDKLNAE